MITTNNWMEKCNILLLILGGCLGVVHGLKHDVGRRRSRLIIEMHEECGKRLIIAQMGI